MHSSSRSAFVFSAVLHALLLGLVVLFAWRGTSRADADNLLVMDVFAPPGEHEENSFTAPPADAPFAEPAAADAAPDEPAEPLLREPDIAPIAAQTFEELKEVPPAPEPEPEPVAPPAEPEPAKVEPTPAPAPTPKPAPKPAPKKVQPKVMTAEEFKKTMGLPKQARAPAPKPAPTTRGTGGTGRAPVKIETSNITRSLEGLLASGNSARVSRMSSSDQSALLSYLGRLRVNIRAAWVLPDVQSGQAEWAEVLVTIEPNGRVSDVRIGKHEGSKAFLDSITKAVRSARSVGPTPSGQREYARYTLNLREM